MPLDGESQPKPSGATRPELLTQIHWPTSLVGLAVGLMLSFGVLSGDAQGRVNLLFLLVIFVAIPVFSLFVATLGFIMNKGLNLAQMVSFISNKLGGHIKNKPPIALPRLNQDWLFLQSQFAAISYSVGSIFGLLFLLLFSDINFIWRSTILSPDDVLPVLEIIALPWWFWADAQPDYAILQATKDSRLAIINENPAIFAYWWPFVFATQLVYSFGLRVIALVLVKQLILRKAKRITDFHSASHISSYHNAKKYIEPRAKIIDQLSDKSVLVNWAGFEVDVLNQISRFSKTSDILMAGPMATDDQQAAAENDQRQQLVVVKSWEPPLGELSDYLNKTHGAIMPVEIKDNQLIAPGSIHLDEWCRFTAEHPNWHVYLPQQLQVHKKDV